MPGPSDLSPIERARCFLLFVRVRAATKQEARCLNHNAQQRAFDPSRPLAIPSYLQQTYRWAYIYPNAVSIFERQWLVITF